MSRNPDSRSSVSFLKKVLIFVFSILAVVFQIFIYYGMLFTPFGASSTSAFIITYVVGQFAALFLSLWVIYRERQASYRLAWVFLIMLLPYFFVPLYIFNQISRRMPRKKRIKFERYMQKYKVSSVDVSDDGFLKVCNLINLDTGFSLFKNTNICFFKDALLKHKDMLEKIRDAKKYIFIETFIISSGILFDELYEVLRLKSEQGLEIKILYDDIGSKRCFKSKDKKKLSKLKNLTLVNYNPFGVNLSPGVNYRDHRKITIIDGLYAYCGGDNLASEYVHYSKRFGYWRDNVCRYQGDAIYSFLLMFCSMWAAACNEFIDLSLYFNFNHGINNSNYVIPFGDSPNKKFNISHDAFIELIHLAKKSIYISTPYFIIDDELINSLILAKKTGVDVKLLVPGIPDKKAVFQLTRAHYKQLLLADIEIYEFTPGFNHSKNLIIDDRYCFVGTTNFDYRSMYLHYECGALFTNKEVIDEIAFDFIESINVSTSYTFSDYKKRNIFSKFLSFIFKILSPML